jgi:hypothetical protein
MIFGMTAMTIFQIAMVAMSIGSMIYQMMQTKKTKAQDNSAAEARKGYEIVVEGQADSLPIVYGRAKVGGVRVYHAVSSDYIFPELTATTQADFVLQTGQNTTSSGQMKVVRTNPVTGKKEYENRNWQFTADTALNKTRTDSGRNEYLFFQQAMSVGPINRVIDVIIDESRYLDDPALNTYGTVPPGNSYTAEEDPSKTLWNNADAPRAAMRIDLHYGGTPRADAVMSANFPERSTATFNGIAYASAVVRIDRHNPQFSNVPQLQFLVEGRIIHTTIERNVNGKIVYSLSDDKVYSNNPAWCLLDYLMDEESGAGVDKTTEIDLASFHSAALICAKEVMTNVPVAGKVWQPTGGPIVKKRVSLPLYECNIIVDTKKTVRENVEAILATMGDARLVWSGGVYKLSLQYPGLEVDAAGNITEMSGITAATLTDDDLVLEQSIDITWPGATERLNFCTVKYHNEMEDFKEDSVSWPPKYTAGYPVGVGGTRPPLSTFSYPEEDTGGRFLNLYGVWSGTTGQTAITYHIYVRNEDAGAAVLKVAGDDTGTVTIVETSTTADGTVTETGTPTTITGSAKVSGEVTVTVGNSTAPKGFLTYKISLSGANATADKAVAASLVIGSKILWTSREPQYSYIAYVETDERVYRQFLAEDNNVRLENETFAEGCTDYQHAYAKAQELVRTSRTAYVIKFRYIVTTQYLEPGDFVRLNSATLWGADAPLGAASKYFRINSVKMADDNTCEVVAQHFDPRTLAWNSSPLTAYVPPALTASRVPAPYDVFYVAGVGEGVGRLYWRINSTLPDLTFSVAINRSTDNNLLEAFDQLAYGLTDNFYDLQKVPPGDIIFRVVAHLGQERSLPGYSSGAHTVDLYPSKYYVIMEDTKKEGFLATTVTSNGVTTLSWGAFSLVEDRPLSEMDSRPAIAYAAGSITSLPSSQRKWLYLDLEQPTSPPQLMPASGQPSPGHYILLEFVAQANGIVYTKLSTLKAPDSFLNPRTGQRWTNGSKDPFCFEEDTLRIRWAGPEANNYNKDVKVAKYSAKVYTTAVAGEEFRREFFIKIDPETKGGEFVFTLADNIYTFGNATREFIVVISTIDTNGHYSPTPLKIPVLNPPPVISQWEVAAAFGHAEVFVVEVTGGLALNGATDADGAHLFTEPGGYSKLEFTQYTDTMPKVRVGEPIITTESYAKFEAEADVRFWYTVRAHDNYGAGTTTNYSNAVSTSLVPEVYTYVGLNFKPNSRVDPTATNSPIEAIDYVWWHSFQFSKDGGLLTNVAEGEWQYPGSGVLYLYLDPVGVPSVKGHTDIDVAVTGRILATYKGKADLTADEGKAFISGDQILAGTVAANQLHSSTLITGGAQVGTIIQSKSHTWSEGGNGPCRGWSLAANGRARFNSLEVRAPNGDLVLKSGGHLLSVDELEQLDPTMPDNLPDYISMDFSRIQPEPGSENYFPTVNTPRGPWSATTPYVIGNIVTDNSGNSWSCITSNTGVPLPILPDEENGAWVLFVRGGRIGHTTVKGSSFARCSQQPQAPAAGDHADYNATGAVVGGGEGSTHWSDGVPPGTQPVYITQRTFSTDPALDDGIWSTPVIMAANGGVGQPGSGVFARFSSSINGPWSPSSAETSVYMCIGKGLSFDAAVWETPVKIKGEDGVTTIKHEYSPAPPPVVYQGVSAALVSINNEQQYFKDSVVTSIALPITLQNIAVSSCVWLFNGSPVASQPSAPYTLIAMAPGNYKVSVTGTPTNSENPITISDVVDLYEYSVGTDGKDAAEVNLSNQNVTFTAGATGYEGIVLSNGVCGIKVSVANTVYSFSSSASPAPGQFSVTGTASGFSAATPTIASSANGCNVTPAGVMQSDQAKISLVVRVNNQGVITDYPRELNYSVSRAGVTDVITTGGTVASYVFKRSTVALTARPTGGDFNDPVPSDTNWKENIDDTAGTLGDLWMSRAVFSDPQVGAVTWSMPAKIASGDKLRYVFSSTENGQYSPTPSAASYMKLQEFQASGWVDVGGAIRIKGENGSSAVQMDLTSESDITAANADGTGYVLPPDIGIDLYLGGSPLPVTRYGFIGESAVTVSNYSNTHVYAVGEIAKSGSNYYQCKVATVAGTAVTNTAAWGAVTYVAGDGYYVPVLNSNGLIVDVGATAIFRPSSDWKGANSAVFTFAVAYGGAYYKKAYTYARSLAGDSAMFIDLLQENMLIASDWSGNVTATSFGSNGIRLYQGGVKLTAGVTYSIVGADTIDGLKATVASDGALSFAESPKWLTSSATVTFVVKATYNGVSYNAQVALSKSKEGKPGEVTGAIPLFAFTRTDAAMTTEPTGYTIGGVPTNGPNGAVWSDGIPTNSSLPLYMVRGHLDGATATWGVPSLISRDGVSGDGAFLRFSVDDGLSGWHYPATAADMYMQSGRGTSRAYATWEGSVKFRGENVETVVEATYVRIAGERVFNYDRLGGTAYPASIRLEALPHGGAVGPEWFIVAENGTETALNVYTFDITVNTTSVAWSSRWGTANSLTLRCRCSNGAYDDHQLIKTYDATVGDVDILFIRSELHPFNDGPPPESTLDLLPGWSTTPPDATEAGGHLWTITGIKSTTASGSKYLWSGLKNIDNVSSVELTIYFKGVNKPAKLSDTALKYNVKTGSFASALPSGWTKDLPTTRGEPWWVSKALFTAKIGTKTAMPVKGWTDPVAMSAITVNGSLTNSLVQIDADPVGAVEDSELAVESTGLEFQLFVDGDRANSYTGADFFVVVAGVKSKTAVIGGLRLTITKQGAITLSHESGASRWQQSLTKFDLEATYGGLTVAKKLTAAKMQRAIPVPMVEFTNTYPSFKRSESGVVAPTAITLETVIRDLGAPLTYKWSYKKPGVATPVLTNVTTATYSVAYSDYAAVEETRDYIVEVTGYFNGEVKTVKDIITIPVHRDGLSALNVQVENDNIQIQGPVSGYSFPNSGAALLTTGTSLKVLLGTKQLKAWSAVAPAHTYKYAARVSSADLTFASDLSTGASGGVLLIGSDGTLNVPRVESISKDTVEVFIDITPYGGDGAALPSLTTKLTYFVNRPYSQAPTVEIANSNPTFYRDASLKMSPPKIELKAVVASATSLVAPEFEWTYKESADDTTSRTFGSGIVANAATLDLPATFFTAAAKLGAILVTVKVTATSGLPPEGVTDTVTVGVLSSGGSGVTVLMSNENIPLSGPPKSDTVQVQPDIALHYCDFRVFIGDKQLKWKANTAIAEANTYRITSITPNACTLRSATGAKQPAETYRVYPPKLVTGSDAFLTVKIQVYDGGKGMTEYVKRVYYPVQFAGVSGLSQYLMLTPDNLGRGSDGAIRGLPSDKNITANLLSTSTTGTSVPYSAILVGRRMLSGGSAATPVKVSGSQLKLSAADGAAGKTSAVEVSAFYGPPIGDSSLATWIAFAPALPDATTEFTLAPTSSSTYVGIAFNKKIGDAQLLRADGVDVFTQYAWAKIGDAVKQPASIDIGGAAVDLYTWLSFDGGTGANMLDAPSTSVSSKSARVALTFNQVSATEVEQPATGVVSYPFGSPIKVSAGIPVPIASSSIVVAADGKDSTDFKLGWTTKAITSSSDKTVPTANLAATDNTLSLSYGGKPYTYAATKAPGTFTVTPSCSDGLEISTAVNFDSTTKVLEIPAILKISNDVDGGTVFLKVDYVDPSGAEGTFTVSYSIAKSPQGEAGTAGITVNNSNATHVISCDANADPVNYDGSGTDIKVFWVDKALEFRGTYKSSDNPNTVFAGMLANSFKISLKGAGIKVPLDANLPSGGSGVEVAAIPDSFHDMTATNATCTYTILAKLDDGSALTLTSVQSFAKAVGVAGKGAPTLRIIAKGASGGVFASTSAEDASRAFIAQITPAGLPVVHYQWKWQTGASTSTNLTATVAIATPPITRDTTLADVTVYKKDMGASLTKVLVCEATIDGQDEAVVDWVEVQVTSKGTKPFFPYKEDGTPYSQSERETKEAEGYSTVDTSTDGYIAGNLIANSSINSSHIGELKVGGDTGIPPSNFKVSSRTANEGAGMVLTANGITIYDGNGTPRVRLGLLV